MEEREGLSYLQLWAWSLVAIRSLGAKAGCVINPPTPLKDLLPYVHLADYVLVMTVNPGFGGQKMIESCVEKIESLKAFIEERDLHIPIEVDGGVNLETLSTVADAGADIVFYFFAYFH